MACLTSAARVGGRGWVGGKLWRRVRDNRETEKPKSKNKSTEYSSIFVLGDTRGKKTPSQIAHLCHKRETSDLSFPVPVASKHNPTVDLQCCVIP